MRDRRSREPSLLLSPPPAGAPPGAPTLRLTGNRREGYANACLTLKGEPSRLLAETGQHHGVHPAPALEVALAHDALFDESQAAGQRPRGGVLGGGGDLDPL